MNYLGPNLPVEDIIQATRKHTTTAVSLSITYPPDGPKLRFELETLRAGLPEKTQINISWQSVNGSL